MNRFYKNLVETCFSNTIAFEYLNLLLVDKRHGNVCIINKITPWGAACITVMAL